MGPLVIQLFTLFTPIVVGNIKDYPTPAANSEASVHPLYSVIRPLLNRTLAKRPHFGGLAERR